jgi:KUP system potassium uptake protein
MAPIATLVPLVVIATLATIIASQATISGAFSITRQAVQLDLLPRLAIVQTSSDEHGQIYVPRINLLMFIAVVLFVLGFRSSSALSGAYGAAVVGTMTITSLLALVVARLGWGWSWLRVIGLFGLFILVDLAFLAGNMSKIATGGWIPLLLAAMMYALFVVWRDGRRRLRDELVRRAVPLKNLRDALGVTVRVPGTAVYLVSQPGYVPTAMLRNLEHNRVAHRQVVILNLSVKPEPRIANHERVKMTEEFPGVISVEAAFGFMETLSVAEALRAACAHGLQIDEAGVSYFVGWHLVKAPVTGGISGLKGRAFAYLQRRSTQAAEFFHMPGERVVILATDIALPPTST